jgi:uncharacterized protein YfeS
MLACRAAVGVAIGHDQFKDLSIDSFYYICSVKAAVFGDQKTMFGKEEMSSTGFNFLRL